MPIEPNGYVGIHPAVNSIPVTPHDSNEIIGNPLQGIDAYPRGFICNVAGTVKFTDLDDNDDTWTVLASVMYAICYKKIFSTGTTATGIHAIW